MKGFIYLLEEVKTYLEKLLVDEHKNALNDVLHIASWHKGIDWVRWVNENKEIINELIKYDYFINCPETLRDKTWESIREIKQLDR